MDGHGVQALIWLVVALGAGVFEILTVDFTFLMIGGGALLAAVAAVLGVPEPVQILLFALASVALVLGVRPPLKHWALSTPHSLTGVAALVGQEARVLVTVTDSAGEVKLGGEVWTARLAPGERSLEVGSQVYVLAIEGATAVVAAHPPTSSPHPLEGDPTP
jgi:membrane protein implicated in regulation of membrane protease activity